MFRKGHAGAVEQPDHSRNLYGLAIMRVHLYQTRRKNIPEGEFTAVTMNDAGIVWGKIEKW